MTTGREVEGAMGELKKVNIAQLFAIIIQVGAFVWFAATQTAQIETHKTQIAETKAQVKVLTDAQVKLGEDLAEMKGTLNYQKNVLDNINQVIMKQ